ncbi:MAG: carboxylesterase/lipase family protein [Acidimicrobiia bacterium]
MVVTTTNGPVAGLRFEGGESFASIPFAAPPVGPLRFAPPRPPRAWTDVRDCSAPGPWAPQAKGTLDTMFNGSPAPQSEDCLALTVTTPACDDARRQVMVYVHGGAFVTGSPNVPWYRGNSFARRGIVTVNVSYRLGALGFADLGTLSEDPRFATTGNNGLLDIIAGLEWVRDNIAAFGGDPEQVTIFGESAGGCAVISLMAMPAARGLFHRAIAQSPSVTQIRTRAQSRMWAERWLEALRVDDPIAALSCTADEILAAQATVLDTTDPARFEAFSPTIGTPQLPVHPLEAFASGLAPQLPLIVGTNADEMQLFAVLDPTHHAIDNDELIRRTSAYVGGAASQLVSAASAHWPTLTPPALWSRLGTDWTFRRPAQTVAADHVGPTWVYEFHWPTPVFGGLLGSCHALEIPFAFNTLDAAGIELFTGAGEERLPLAERMNGAWAAFATNSDPNHPGLVDHWPQFDRQRRSTYVFDTTDRRVDDPDAPVRTAWDAVLASAAAK